MLEVSAPTERIGGSNFARMLFLAFMILLFVSCGYEDIRSKVVSKTVGPEGGEILGPPGTKVIIPAGALSKKKNFSITQLDNDVVPPNGGMKRLSIALWITPEMSGGEEFEFNLPITVEMSYNPGRLSNHQQTTELAAYHTLRFQPDWEELSGSVQLNLHHYLAKTKKLGVFAVYHRGEIETDGDEDIECGRGCDHLVGEWCAPDYGSDFPDMNDTESCGRVGYFSVEVPVPPACEYRVSVFDGSGERIQSFGIVCNVDGDNTSDGDIDIEAENCFSPITITFEGLGECGLTYNDQGEVLNLECEACSDTYAHKNCYLTTD